MGIAAFIVMAAFAKPLRIQMSALGSKPAEAVRAERRFISAITPKADMTYISAIRAQFKKASP